MNFVLNFKYVLLDNYLFQNIKLLNMYQYVVDNVLVFINLLFDN